MKEFIDKLIARLEELKSSVMLNNKCCKHIIDKIIEIVNELAEEYKNKSVIMDDLKIFLQKKFDYCAEQAGMNLEAECNSEIASYFRERKELYLDRANIYGEVMREIDRLAEEYNNDFCEWKKQTIGSTELIREPHRMYLFKTSDDEWVYCPYCGKKIKVVE